MDGLFNLFNFARKCIAPILLLEKGHGWQRRSVCKTCCFIVRSLDLVGLPFFEDHVANHFIHATLPTLLCQKGAGVR